VPGYRAARDVRHAGLQQGLSAARRHGPRGTLTTAVQRVRPRVWLDEEHIWYQLDLATGATPDLGTLEFITPRAAQLAAFDTVPTINAVQAAERVPRAVDRFSCSTTGRRCSPAGSSWIARR